MQKVGTKEMYLCMCVTYRAWLQLACCKLYLHMGLQCTVLSL